MLRIKYKIIFFFLKINHFNIYFNLEIINDPIFCFHIFIKKFYMEIIGHFFSFLIYIHYFCKGFFLKNLLYLLINGRYIFLRSISRPSITTFFKNRRFINRRFEFFFNKFCRLKIRFFIDWWIKFRWNIFWSLICTSYINTWS